MMPATDCAAPGTPIATATSPYVVQRPSGIAAQLAERGAIDVTAGTLEDTGVGREITKAALAVDRPVVHAVDAGTGEVAAAFPETIKQPSREEGGGVVDLFPGAWVAPTKRPVALAGDEDRAIQRVGRA